MQTNWSQEEQKFDVTAMWCKTSTDRWALMRARTVPICILHRGELGVQKRFGRKFLTKESYKLIEAT